MFVNPDQSMSHDQMIPAGTRPASRVLVISDASSILLLHAQDSMRQRWWLLPGGGLGSGESFEDAARRELLEETGCDLPLGPLLWTRRHIYNWNGTPQDQYERYYVARCKDEFVVAPAVPDTYVIGHRWWTLREIENSQDDFTPRRLAEYLPSVLRGDYPKVPFDCGV